jgi:hypothetical protein
MEEVCLKSSQPASQPAPSACGLEAGCPPLTLDPNLLICWFAEAALINYSFIDYLIRSADRDSASSLSSPLLSSPSSLLLL